MIQMVWMWLIENDDWLPYHLPAPDAVLALRDACRTNRRAYIDLGEVDSRQWDM